MSDMSTLFTTDFWYMAPILSSITVTLTGAINGKFNITKGIYPQLVSWIVATLLSIGSWFLGFINLGEPTWLAVVMLCVVTGLSSNGIYDIPTIKDFVDRVFNRNK